MKSEKRSAREARYNGRLRGRTKRVVRLWEVRKVASAVSTSWEARHTWLGSKWIGAETVSANWVLPEFLEGSLRRIIRFLSVLHRCVHACSFFPLVVLLRITIVLPSDFIVPFGLIVSSMSLHVPYTCLPYLELVGQLARQCLF